MYLDRLIVSCIIRNLTDDNIQGKDFCELCRFFEGLAYKV